MKKKTKLKTKLCLLIFSIAIIPLLTIPLVIEQKVSQKNTNITKDKLTYQTNSINLSSTQREQISCKRPISWRELTGEYKPPYTDELIQRKFDDIVKRGMVNPNRGWFFKNQDQLNIRADEIEINNIYNLSNNPWTVSVDFTVRGQQLNTWISDLAIYETTLADVIDAERSNDLASSQNEESLRQILNNKREIYIQNLPGGWWGDRWMLQVMNIEPNDDEGTLLCDIKLNQVNTGDKHLFKKVKFINFRNWRKNSVLSTNLLIIKNINNVLPSSITNLNNNSDQTILKIKESLSEKILQTNGEVLIDDIELIKKNFNDEEGSMEVSVKLNNNKFVQNTQPVQSATFANNVIIKGFKTFVEQPKLTTTMTNNIVNVRGVSDVNLYDVDFNRNDDPAVLKTKNAIIDMIIDPVSKVVPNDISFSRVRLGPEGTGFMRADVRLLNGKYQHNGNPEPEHVFSDLFIDGFSLLRPTPPQPQPQPHPQPQPDPSRTTTIKTVIEIPGVSDLDPNLIPNFGNKNDPRVRKIKQGIIPAISNPAGIVTIDDIEIYNVQSSPASGPINVLVQLNNNKYQENGVTKESHNFEGITLTGFKVPGINPEPPIPPRPDPNPQPQPQPTITTTINNNIYINGVGNIDPSSINFNNQNDQTVLKIKQEVINSITNPTSAIQNNDISFKNTSPNSASGTIITTIVLSNNKYQNNGSPESVHEFSSIVLNGFKTSPVIQNQTSLKKTTLTPQDISISNWYVDFDQNEVATKVINYLNSNINNFFVNPLPDTKISSVQFGNFNSNNGTIQVTITFNGQQNGVQNTNMKGNLTLIQLKSKQNLSYEINNLIRPVINNLIKYDFNSDEASMIFVIKNSIANTLNNSRQNLPKKLFEQSILTTDDIEMIASYKNKTLSIMYNRLKRLGGIDLCTGIFNGNMQNNQQSQNQTYKKEQKWIIPVVVCSIVGFIFILCFIFYIIKNKKKSYRDDLYY